MRPSGEPMRRLWSGLFPDRGHDSPDDSGCAGGDPGREHCLTSGKEAKHRFKEKLKELRMHWDKEAGAYVSDDSEPAQ